MGKQESFGKKKGEFKKKKQAPTKIGFRAPKHERTLRQYDLAPVADDGMTRQGRQVAAQLKAEREGTRYRGKRRTGPDTVGMETKEIILPVSETTDLEFSTIQREGETVMKFAHRIKMEQLRKERELAGGYEKKASEGQLRYRRELRQKKAEKKRAKMTDKDDDEEFTGHSEHISFGERVDRPPSFDDLQLPGEKLMSGKGAGKKGGNNVGTSNLEKLQRALANANDEVREKYAVSTDMLSNNGELQDLHDHEDDSPQVRELKKQKRKEKQADREKLLQEQREKQREIELEKARIQAQQAYALMKSKRNANNTGKIHMGSLTSSTSAIHGGGVQATRNLHSLDGGIYHHGKK